MSDDPQPGLTLVPDDAKLPEAPSYTVRDQVLTNAELVAQIVKEHGISDVAAVSLVGLTYQVHLQKIQLGLSAPVEG